MKYRISLIGVILFFVGTIILFQNSAKSLGMPRTGQACYCLFNDYSCLRDDCDFVLTELVNKYLAQTGSNRKFSINKPFNENDINIYVVDFRKLQQKADALPTGLRNRVVNTISVFENNFTCLPPNTIIIDEFFFSNLFVESFNESMAFTEFSVSTGSFTNRYHINKIGSNIQAINSYRRFGNLELFSKFDDDSFSFTGFLKKINFAVPNDDKLKDYLHNIAFPFFLPLLAHEFAHLENPSNVKNTIIDKTKIQIFGHQDKRMRAEEDRADLRANKVISDYLSMQGNPIGSFESTFKHIMLLGFTRYMRDWLLYRSLDGLRGVSARDYLFEIRSKAENALGAKNIDHSFIDLDSVDSARLLPFPIMTQEEHEAVLAKMFSDSAAKHHSHILLRLEKIVDGIPNNSLKEMGKANILEFSIHLMANRINDYSELYHVKPDTATTIETSEIKTMISNWEQCGFGRAVNFSCNGCEIAVFKNTVGFVELYDKGGRLCKMHFVQQVPDFKGNEVLYIKSSAQYMGMLKLVLEKFQVSDPDKIVYKTMSYLRSKHRFFPRVNYQCSKGKIECGYLNNSNMMYINLNYSLPDLGYYWSDLKVK